MPAQDGKLARDGDGGDLMASPGADADEEGMKRSSRLGCCPGSFHQHGTGMATTDLADTPVMGGTQSRLAYPRVQAKVAHEFPGALEPADIADRGHDPRGDCEIDACDRHQPLSCLVIERIMGDLAIEDVKIFGEAVELPHVPVDGAALVVGQRLACQPRPTAGAE
jgi:hypothetical protein